MMSASASEPTTIISIAEMSLTVCTSLASIKSIYVRATEGGLDVVDGIRHLMPCSA